MPMIVNDGKSQVLVPDDTRYVILAQGDVDETCTWGFWEAAPTAQAAWVSMIAAVKCGYKACVSRVGEGAR